jgi:hypothetical protein
MMEKENMTSLFMTKQQWTWLRLRNVLKPWKNGLDDLWFLVQVSLPPVHQLPPPQESRPF